MGEREGGRYDYELARSDRRPEPGPAHCERIGRLVWVRGAGTAPGAAAAIGELCVVGEKVRAGGDRLLAHTA